jgi:hypothetical protein
VELHEKLNFFLAISPNSALDKIMIKKLAKFLEDTNNNSYVKYIGTKRRQDPKEEESEGESQQQPKVLKTEEDSEDFDS